MSHPISTHDLIENSTKQSLNEMYGLITSTDLEVLMDYNWPDIKRREVVSGDTSDEDSLASSDTSISIDGVAQLQAGLDPETAAFWGMVFAQQASLDGESTDGESLDEFFEALELDEFNQPPPPQNTPERPRVTSFDPLDADEDTRAFVGAYLRTLISEDRANLYEEDEDLYSTWFTNLANAHAAGQLLRPEEFGVQPPPDHDHGPMYARFQAGFGLPVNTSVDIGDDTKDFVGRTLDQMRNILSNISIEAKTPSIDKLVDSVGGAANSVVSGITDAMAIAIGIPCLVVGLWKFFNRPSVNSALLSVFGATLLYACARKGGFVKHLTALVSEAFDMVAPSVAVSQGLHDIFSGIGRLILSVVAICTIGKKPTSRSTTEFMRSLSALPKASEGFDTIVSWTMKAIESATNWIRMNILGLDMVTWADETAPDVKQWADKVCIFMSKCHRGEMPVTANSADAINALIMEGTRFSIKYFKSPDHARVRDVITQFMTLLRKQENKYMRASYRADSYRREPLSILFRGAPGTGKTQLTQHLTVALAVSCLDFNRWLDLKGDMASVYYNRRPNDQYWSSYHGQPIILIDDIFCTADYKGNPVTVTTAMEFLHMVGMNDYQLNMADLSEKGTTNFRGEVIIATSNVRDFCHIVSMTDNEAIERRFDYIVDVVPKEEFTLPDTLNGDLWNRRLNLDKVKEFALKTKGYDCWVEEPYELRVWDRKLKQTSQVLDFQGFLDLAIQKKKSKDERYENFGRTINEIIEKLEKTRYQEVYKSVQSEHPKVFVPMEDIPENQGLFDKPTNKVYTLEEASRVYMNMRDLAFGRDEIDQMQFDFPGTLAHGPSDPTSAEQQFIATGARIEEPPSVTPAFIRTEFTAAMEEFIEKMPARFEPDYKILADKARAVDESIELFHRINAGNLHWRRTNEIPYPDTLRGQLRSFMAGVQREELWIKLEKIYGFDVKQMVLNTPGGDSWLIQEMQRPFVIGELLRHWSQKFWHPFERTAESLKQTLHGLYECIQKAGSRIMQQYPMLSAIMKLTGVLGGLYLMWKTVSKVTQTVKDKLKPQCLRYDKKTYILRPWSTLSVDGLPINLKEFKRKTGSNQITFEVDGHEFRSYALEKHDLAIASYDYNRKLIPEDDRSDPIEFKTISIPEIPDAPLELYSGDDVYFDGQYVVDGALKHIRGTYILQAASGEQHRGGTHAKTTRTLHPKLSNLKPAMAQAGIDLNAQDILTKVAKSNLYNIHLPDGRRMGSLTFIRGAIAMVPKHFIPYWNERVTLGHMEADAQLTLKNPITNQQFKFTLKNLKIPEGLERFKGRDVTFMQIDCVPPHKDITRHFVSDAFIKSRHDRNMMLAVLNPDMPKLYLAHYELHTECKIRQNQDSPIETAANCAVLRAPTTEGDCGSLGVVDCPQAKGKLFYMHIAGHPSDGKAIGCVLTLEDIEDAMAHFVDNLPLPKGLEDLEEDIYQHQNGAMAVAILPKGVHNPGKTKIRKSVLHDKITKSILAPAKLKPFVNTNGVLINPMDNAIGRYQTPGVAIDPMILAIAAHHVYCTLVNTSVTQVPKQVYTFDEAVLGRPGDPYCNSIPRGTGAGYDVEFLGVHGRGKIPYFGDGDEYDLSNKLCQRLREKVSRTIEDAAQGIRNLHIFSDFLKDETRKIPKVKEGKTRLISGSPLTLLIATRQYFLSFSEWMMKNRVYNGSCVGVNAYSIDWEHLASQLRKLGLLTFAGDFVGLDSSAFQQILMCILDNIINPWYDDGPRNAEIRRILWMEVWNSFHASGLTLFQWIAKLPSGHPLTTIINTLVVMILMRLSFMVVYGTESIGEFNRVVILAVYGDDNVVNIHPDIAEHFNQRTLMEIMPQFGYTYTSENKEDDPPPTRRLDEVTFLKRHFRVDSLVGRTVAPLDLQTILEIPMWTKSGGASLEITKDNVVTAVEELSLHNPDTFSKWIHVIVSASQEHLQFVPPVVHRTPLLRRVCNKETWW